MQFFYDYSIFLDVVALIGLVGLAIVAVVQNKSAAMGILAVVVSIWAIIRISGLV